MGRIVFPVGEILSSPSGNFFFPLGVAECQLMTPVTVEETRRLRLGMLVSKHGGMAELCEKLGYARNQTAGLTRILNANLRHDRDSKPYVMGSPMARQIESKLDLPLGWMDTPPSYADLHGLDSPRAKAMAMLENLPEYQVPTAARLIDALTEPEKGDEDNNGTTG